MIIQEIGKFDVKIDVIPNALKKCMACTTNRKSNFIDSMQFMNSSLDVLVKSLFHNDFKYLLQEFSGKLLNLVKQRFVYSYEYMNSCKGFFDDSLPDRCEFYNSLEDECVSKKHYLHAINV